MLKLIKPIEITINIPLKRNIINDPEYDYQSIENSCILIDLNYILATVIK